MPVIYATSHVDHEKGVAWFSICVHVYGSLPIVIEGLLGSFSGYQNSAVKADKIISEPLQVRLTCNVVTKDHNNTSFENVSKKLKPHLVKCMSNRD